MNNNTFIDWAQSQMYETSVYKDKIHNSLVFRDGVLYSYGRHYPLAFIIKNKKTHAGFMFRNISGYSVTTGKHISLCSRDYDVRLHLSKTNKYDLRKNLYKETKSAIMNELKIRRKEIKKLSERAWRQRKYHLERVEEIENILLVVFNKEV